MSHKEKNTEKLKRVESYGESTTKSPDPSSPVETLADQAENPAPASQPEIIGERWLILERLGEGGMSVVYKAKHLEINRVVAIKVLLPHLTSNAKNLKRMMQEGKAAGSLNHPNVMKIDDFGHTSDGRTFIIMEFINGRSLAEVIEQEGKLEPMRALFIFVQAVNALSHAHERNIIHRDLKPSNLMLVPDEEHDELVKVVDFGIAKLLGDEEEQMLHLTQTGEVFGSPLYMSPEQCRGQKLDARSDIYSMGCLMYETLSGKAPIRGANILDTMQRQLSEMPVPLVDERAPDSLLKRLNAIVIKCLAKDREDRYRTMADLETDLSRALLTAEKDWKNRARGLKKLIKPSQTKRSSGRRLQIALSAGLLSLLVFGYVYSFVLYSPAKALQDEPASLWTEIKPHQVSESADYFEKRSKLSALEDRARVNLRTFVNLKGEITPEQAPIVEETIRDLTEQGSFYKQNGKWDIALLSYKNASTLCDRLHLGNSATAASIWRNIADIHAMLGQYWESFKALSHSIAIVRQVKPSEVDLLEPLMAMERLQSKLNYLPAAEKDCSQLIKIFNLIALNRLNTMRGYEEWTKRAPVLLTFYISERADLLRRQHIWDQAKAEYQESVKRWQHEATQSPQQNKSSLATALYGLALVETNCNEISAAVDHFKQAYELARESGMDPGFITRVRGNYACALRKSNPLSWVIFQVNG